ncbi:MAG: hypothetical protein NTY38_19170 [Acidobacteria bacterium]|nr:hypothetical protein [Acidobacteriota bacterium]
MRFDEMVRAGNIIRDIKVKYPGTVAIFDDYGFRASCDDCSIEAVARKHGLASQDIVEKLNEAIFLPKS